MFITIYTVALAFHSLYPTKKSWKTKKRGFCNLFKDEDDDSEDLDDNKDCGNI